MSDKAAKPVKRRRGRPPGSKNKFSIARARKAAASYYAPKLSSIEAKVDPFGSLTDAALDARIARLTAELQGSADGPGLPDERRSKKED